MGCPLTSKVKTIGFFTCVAIIISILPAWSFSVVEPKESSVQPSGAKFVVILDTGEVTGITKVKYYWYREQEDMLQEFVEDKLALVATAKSTPPFGGVIQIPIEAMGKYRLLAVGEQEGRQSEDESLAIFDEVFIQIEPTTTLLEIDFQTDKPLRLGRAGAVRVYDQVDFLGKTFELPVIGRFADGTVRSMSSQSSGTTYQLDNNTVVAINQDGLLRLVGNGETILTVKNRGQVARLEILVEVNTELNHPPLSDPGHMQTVYSGEKVTLNGLGSYDPEGSSLKYHWSQVRGSKIPLLDPYSEKATFLAPFVAEERTFQFKLRVTDIQGADSQASYINVLVQP